VSLPRDWFFFDEPERKLVADALAVVEGRDPGEGALLRRSLGMLEHAGMVIRECPAIHQTSSSSRRTGRPAEELVDLLCRVPDYDLDLNIPTKAVLGQGFLIAKINFFKALGYAVAAVDGHDDLRVRLELELGQSIYSKLAEELFVSIVTDPSGAREVKLRAARFLFRIWEERLVLEIDDFAPLLESVWRARNRVRPVLGTMMGASELFSLFREARGDEFLDYFGCDDVPEEQSLAFEEFLFGISHEEIQTLRAHLDLRSAQVVSPEQARQLLGRNKASWAPPADGPQALYTSYKKRRVKAQYRVITGAPGPKKTAEEYVMTAFLQRGSLSSDALAGPMPGAPGGGLSRVPNDTARCLLGATEGLLPRAVLR
jgi:hypothetical protein